MAKQVRFQPGLTVRELNLLDEHGIPIHQVTAMASALPFLSLLRVQGDVPSPLWIVGLRDARMPQTAGIKVFARKCDASEYIDEVRWSSDHDGRRGGAVRIA